MTWYAAHLILYTKFLDGIQDSFPVWENIVLINATTPDEAFAIADKKGAAEADVEEHSYNGRRAAWVYVGARKLNECIENFDPEERSSGGSEEHGTEVTYSSYILPNEDALQKLIGNRDVGALYKGFSE